MTWYSGISVRNTYTLVGIPCYVSNLLENEVVYRVSARLDLEDVSLRLSQVPDLHVEYDPEQGRGHGVLRVWYKRERAKQTSRTKYKARAFASIGPDGGFDIHYNDSLDDLSSFIDLLKANIPECEDMRKTEERHGRSHWVNLTYATALAWFYSLAEHVPPAQAWKTVFPSNLSHEQRRNLELEVEANTVGFTAEVGTTLETEVKVLERLKELNVNPSDVCILRDPA